ncbi:ISP domain-containing protein [Stipitochalara longipes BDJ]|nr:ISP domain-containing protein [Stipitochalara longipes BDJ]
MAAGDHTLPASWWVSEKIYELEKRAIFSKSWILAMHRSRFTKAGDYHRLDIAGFPIILIQGKDGTIQAFHNVCRHRAYPIVNKDSGSSLVLGCKYHGWSYDTKGSLIKAPGFETVPNFDKTVNGLFKVATYTTRQGLIFVNFDSTPMITPFHEFYKGLEDEMDEFDFGEFEYVESWQQDGEFNWKTLLDGYNECYHCPTAHPSFSKVIQVPTYKVEPRQNYARHSADIVVPDANTKATVVDSRLVDSSWSSWLGLSSPASKTQSTAKVDGVQGDKPGLWLSLFPLNGMNCYSYAWYYMRIIPKSAGRTVLEYDIFARRGEDQAKIREFIRFLKEVEIEDYDLCTLTQKNLKNGVYGTGQLHPDQENGVLYYQNLTKEFVIRHLEDEKVAGRQIFPAFAGLNAMDGEGKETDRICKQLECGGHGSGILSW